MFVKDLKIKIKYSVNFDVLLFVHDNHVYASKEIRSSRESTVERTQPNLNS